VPINAETFERYYRSIIPYKRMTERRTYQLLRRSKSRLDQTVGLHTNVYSAGRGATRSRPRYDAHLLALAVTGAVTDWLTYSFIYLLTEETYCKHLGEDELSRFKRATKDAYDRYPAYRFLYQLRNYAHHYGPPLASLDMSATGHGWAIDVMLDKRQILGNGFHWNTASRRVMDGLPERFPISPLIEEAMEGYKLIERRMLGMYLDYVGSWLDASIEMLSALGDVDGIPCLIAIPPHETKSMLILGKIGVLPVMRQADVERVEWALEQPDPVSAVWIHHPEQSGFRPDTRGTLLATQLMTMLLAGEGDVAEQHVEEIVQDGQGGSRSVIIGLAEQLRIALYMLEGLLGGPPEEYLNVDWLEIDEPNNR
jgi:hypothetical protein